MLALLWCRQVLYSLVYCKGHLTNSKTFRHEVINAGVTAYSSRWRGGQHLPPLQAQGYHMIWFCSVPLHHTGGKVACHLEGCVYKGHCLT